MKREALPVSIALTRHREDDEVILPTIEAAARQSGVSGEIIILDQMDSPAILKRAVELTTHDMIVRVLPIPSCGLSEARNFALALACHDIVLFLDADARPKPDWALHMHDALSSPETGIAGARILPDYEATPPVAARSSIVREQYSLLDLGSERRQVHKVIGAGFGLNRANIGDEGWFDNRLGRQDGRLIGGEETDLCERVESRGLKIVYEGRAVVRHFVPAERLRWTWLARRFFHGGASRALRQGKPAPFSKPGASDYLFALPLIPFYLAGLLFQKVFRDRRINRS